MRASDARAKQWEGGGTVRRPPPFILPTPPEGGTLGGAVGGWVCGCVCVWVGGWGGRLVERDGMGWDGVGWDVMGWDAMGWDGMG